MNRFCILAAAVVALAGCGPDSGGRSTAVAAADSGSVKTTSSEAVGSNTYRIADFGVTVDAPEDWHVVESGVMSRLMEAGTNVSTADMDSASKAGVRGSIERTTTLFTFTEFPPGAPREYIPAFLGMAEDVSMLPGVVRGEDYFFHVRRLMAQSTIRTVPAATSTEFVIDGQSFDRMEAETGPAGAALKQRFFSTRHGDVVVSFIQSYRTDAELAVLDRALASIKLDW